MDIYLTRRVIYAVPYQTHLFLFIIDREKNTTGKITPNCLHFPKALHEIPKSLAVHSFALQSALLSCRLFGLWDAPSQSSSALGTSEAASQEYTMFPERATCPAHHTLWVARSWRGSCFLFQQALCFIFIHISTEFEKYASKAFLEATK